MHEVGEHPGLVFEHRAGGPLLAHLDKAVDVGDHRQGGAQAGAVIAVHGMQGPGLDGAPLQGLQGGDHLDRELVADLDIGGGHPPGPVEDEVLAPALKSRQGGGGIGAVAEGELDLEGLIEDGLDLGAAARCRPSHVRTGTRTAR